ncbi:ABC-2 transporter permease [Clostridium lundense]|uniref:ABC-2 transporter permease n=1 Tax=Clostridium lundense TaxID=319475 RepID=UPI0009FF8DAB
MFNLILKDFYLQVHLTFILVLLSFPFRNINSNYIAFSVLIMLFSFAATMEFNDRENKNNSLVILRSLPIDKNIVILSKYLSSCFMYCIYVVIFQFYNFLGSNIYSNIIINPKLIFINLLLFIVLISAYYPISFINNKILNSSVKVAFWLFIMFLFNLWSKIRYLINYLFNLNLKNILTFTIITFRIFITSFFISKFILNKDF